MGSEMCIRDRHEGLDNWCLIKADKPEPPPEITTPIRKGFSFDPRRGLRYGVLMLTGQGDYP